MFKLRFLLIFFTLFLMSLNTYAIFPEVSPEEIIPRMNTLLREVKNLRQATISFIRKLGQAYLEDKAFALNMHNEHIKALEMELADLRACVYGNMQAKVKLVTSIEEFKKSLQNLEHELSEYNDNKNRNNKLRTRELTRQIKKAKAIFQSLEIEKSNLDGIVNEQLGHIKTLTIDLGILKDNPPQFIVQNSIEIPSDSLLIFKIFGDFSEDEFFQIIESIDDLMLTKEYFTEMEENKLIEQIIICFHGLTETSLNCERLRQKESSFSTSITLEDANNFLEFLKKLAELHYLELKRRELKFSVLMNLSTTCISMINNVDLVTSQANTIYADLLKSLTSLQQQQKESMLRESAKRWNVEVSDKVKEMALNTFEKESFDNLVICLEKSFKISSSDKVKHRLTNFGSLQGTKNLYHVHINNDSQKVAVWEVIPESKTIHIFYLGKHKDSYKKHIPKKIVK